MKLNQEFFLIQASSFQVLAVAIYNPSSIGTRSWEFMLLFRSNFFVIKILSTQCRVIIFHVPASDKRALRILD